MNVNIKDRHQQPLEEKKSSTSSLSVPFWRIIFAMFGILATGILFAALPGHITRGYGWLPLIFEVLIVIPVFGARLFWRPLPHHIVRLLSFFLLAVSTIALIFGVVMLVVTLPSRNDKQAGSLLQTAAMLWLCNILVFGFWYWEIDGGGPHARLKAGHKASDFMFPQQVDGNTTGWAPFFVDYLFVAFTGATALSPTDTYPLTWRAKGLMMIEALIAMTIMAIIIGRAVNIL